MVYNIDGHGVFRMRKRFRLHSFRVVNLVFVCDMASIELGAKFNDWDTFEAVALIAESAPMEHTCCVHDAD